jgi:hypothetical protein
MKLRTRILCGLLFVCVLGMGAALGAKKKGCTEEQGQQAEKETDNLKNWESVFVFFRKYVRCDSGGVAEGVSDGVAKLFADRWGTVADFVVMSEQNKNFEKFVLRHVDSNINSAGDTQKIRENAKLHCPANLARLCKELVVKTAPPRDIGPH